MGYGDHTSGRPSHIDLPNNLPGSLVDGHYPVVFLVHHEDVVAFHKYVTIADLYPLIHILSGFIVPSLPVIRARKMIV